jgi:uncharacterized membrane protein
MVFLKHLEWTLVCLAGVLYGAGEEWSLPILQGAGITLMGMIIVALSAQPLWFRDESLKTDTGEKKPGYARLALLVRSIGFMLIGLVIIALGLVDCLVSHAKQIEYLSQQAGMIILSFSACCCTVGISNTLVYMAARGSAIDILKRIPVRLLNLALAVGGLAGTGLGILFQFAPSELSRLADAIFKP